MVKRKSVKATKKEVEAVDMPEDEQLAPAEESRLHRLKRRNNAKRFFGIGIIVVVLVLAGWFTTKLALSGWNVSDDSTWKNLFSLKGTTLIGEETGRINVLLLGNPGGNGELDGPYLTDTVIIASLSTENNNGVFFSLPRDLYIKIPGYGNTKLNAAYKIGNSQEGAGGNTVSQITGDIAGLDIPYFIRVDFRGFEQLINELGGVTVEVEKDLYDEEYPTPDKKYEVLDIKAGTYTMDGAMALKYARSRKSTSDFDRARRQQQLILAMKEKAAELDLLNQPAKALVIADILQDSLETNMNLGEIKRFLELIKDFNVSAFTTKVFDDSPTGLLYGTRVDELYVLRPVGDDFKVISDYVTQIISGEIDPAELEEAKEPLKVEVLNGTNTTGLAGKIADQLDSDGYDITYVGNNSTRGFVKTVIYDLSNGDRIWEVRKLAASLNAEIGEDEVTTTSGALVRIVVGSEAK